jgi:hypothetical protein
MDYYFKSKTAAEAAEEIALLKIKQEWFGFDTIEHRDGQGESTALFRDAGDPTSYHANKDTEFSYDIDSKTKFYSWSIDPGGFQVIPLFYIDGDGSRWDTKSPDFVVNNSSIEANILWNIIGEDWWISGKGSFSSVTGANNKSFDAHQRDFNLDPLNVWEFLNLSDINYLTILNTSNTWALYTISTNDTESFTKPITTIYSTAKIWEIKRNIRLEIDNSQYFDVLKYSIYDS